jgi:uncharacterized membrane protein
MNTATLSIDRPTSTERLAVLIAHAGTVFAWFLAPLVVYLLKRNDSRYVEFHALQSLLWSLMGTLVALATCGLAIPIFPCWHLLAAYRAAEGVDYEYPIVGEIAHSLLV